MYKVNTDVKSMDDLNKESERYAEEIYYIFDGYRNWDVYYFRDRYYPTFSCVCSDSSWKALGESYSHRPSMIEYKKTHMFDEMEKQFCPIGSNITCKKDLIKYSHYSYPIGQYAEQHAANDLLEGLGIKLNIKKDILFGKPIRSSTGEDGLVTYCQNCKELFDI